MIRFHAGALLLAATFGCGAFGTSEVEALPSHDQPADRHGPLVHGVAECDLASTETASPACMTDAQALFVDPSHGEDTRTGTRRESLRTLNAAIDKLGAKTRIYICEGTLVEHVKLKKPVSLFGGFACDSWAYTGRRTRIAPVDPGFALHIDGVSEPLNIVDLDFSAIAGTQTMKSSVAAFVNVSALVTFRRVTLTAQNGANGDNGATGLDGSLASSTPAAGSLAGNPWRMVPGVVAQGGAAQVCTCSTGSVTAGGQGSSEAVNGAPGATAGLPVQQQLDPGGADGAPGRTVGVEREGIPGNRGSNAPPKAVGARASARKVRFGVASPLELDGAAGVDGAPGQGGGGGAGYVSSRSSVTSMIGGGGGGCGGCGGHKGGGGGGGGASVALLLNDAPVVLQNCALNSATAGAGGRGGAGGIAMQGGEGAPSREGFPSAAGAKGGRGSNGSAGAGGAGGVTAGIVFVGVKPTIDATIATGAKGEAGIGGVAGINDGLDGVKADVLEVN